MSSTVKQRVIATAPVGALAVLLLSHLGSAARAASVDVGPASAASKKAAVHPPNAMRRQPDSGQKIARYSKVLAKSPNNAAALMGRGKAYVARRDFASALADYDRATQAAPQSKQARYGREVVRQLLQEQADRALTTAKPARPNTERILDGSQFDGEGTVRSCELPAVDAAAQKMRTIQIIAELDKTAHLNPKLASIWYRKATVCEAAGRMDEAKAAYSEFLNRSKNKNSLAWVQSQARLAALSAHRN